VNKGKISIALSKSIIQRVNEKCRRINRNRSNYIETLVMEDLQKDEHRPAQARTAAELKEEIAIKLG
jgi:metal-responsive CopG/Arc/MetJ family transcriptional regulator